MGVIPGLQHDCFISYRQLDDLGSDGVQGHGWVTQFFDAFRVKLGEYLGRRPDIFMDAELDRSASLTPELDARARASAIFVPIVAPGYKDSAWCRGELDSFREQAESNQRWSIANVIAVRKVVILPLPGDEHNSYPVDDPGYWFFQIDPHTKLPMRIERDQSEYSVRLARLAWESSIFLANLKVQSTSAQPIPPSPATGETAPSRSASATPLVAGTKKEVLLACDASGFGGSETVKVVSCAAVDQPAELSRRMEQLKATVALEPAFASTGPAIARIRRSGLRYEDDDSFLRDRVTQGLAVLPWDGYVSFADSAFWAEKTEADTILQLMYGVLFDRLRGLPDISIRLVLSPRLAPFWQSISSAASDYREQIRSLDSVTVVGTSSILVGGPKDAAVEIANYLGGVTAARLADPRDEVARRRFAWVYPNKLRILRDLRSGVRYSRHRPLPPDWGVHHL